MNCEKTWWHSRWDQSRADGEMRSIRTLVHSVPQPVRTCEIRLCLWQVGPLCLGPAGVDSHSMKENGALQENVYSIYDTPV